jgi:fructoselysine-6-P-deglycase FrlB-like protein
MDYQALQTKLDSSNMMARIDEWPAIFQKGFDLGYAMDLSDEFKSAKHVIGLGMGGSGMAYTILATIARSNGNASFEVISDYNLPPYVHKDASIAVCVTSFSGNTEETL